ncbi:MAG: MlaC/ttg2D family ABC transporter substrate-binding protein [Halothiobacillus sp.]
MNRLNPLVNRFLLAVALLFGFTLLTSAPVLAESTANTPAAAMHTVQQTADSVIHEIAEHQAEITKNSSALLDIIKRKLLPVVDSERMSRLVLGRYWRTASATQKASFTDQFQQLLVRTYAGPLSRLGNQKITVTGTKPGADSDELVVQSVVSGGDMGSVPVDYRMAQVDGQWKAFDVVIDGVSLINNYRGSFAQVIQQKGLDNLIHTLKTQNNG